MISVCIIEDEKSLSDLIQLNLDLEGYKTSTFNNGQEAFDSAQKIAEFDLVLLDVMLPGKSGLDICKEIRKYSDVPILFLSAKGTTEDRIAGLKLGGNDYLSKPFDLEELLLRVSILVNRKNPQKRTAINSLIIGNKEINFNSFEINDLNNGSVITIPKKEIELLRLFEEKENMVISRDEILDRIWGKDQFPTSRTIDNYILTLRKIFEEDPKNPKYFHSIRAVGYKFTNPK